MTPKLPRNCVIPDGWEPLKYGEVFCKGDKKFDYDCWKDRNIFGNKYKIGNYFTIRRKREKIIIQEEEKIKIIKLLDASRAFNEDSAMEMGKKENICLQLCDDGVLKKDGNRFYIEKI